MKTEKTCEARIGTACPGCHPELHHYCQNSRFHYRCDRHHLAPPQPHRPEPRESS